MADLGTIDEKDLPVGAGTIREEEDCPACGQHKVVKAHSLAEKTRYTLQLNPTDRICLGCQHVQPSPLYAPNNFPSRPSEKKEIETVEIQEKDLPKKIKTGLSKDIEQLTGGLVKPKQKEQELKAEPIKKKSKPIAQAKDDKKVENMTDQSEEIKKLNADGVSDSEISRQLNISRWKVSKALKEMGLKTAGGRGKYQRDKPAKQASSAEPKASEGGFSVIIPESPKLTDHEQRILAIEEWIASWKNKK